MSDAVNRPRHFVPPSATRLSSPYDKAKTETKNLQSSVSAIDYDYLLRAVLAGQRGAADSIVGTFFKAFVDEVKRECIPTYYDPDNESRVAGILARLNFRPVPTTPDPEQLQGHALDTAHGGVASRTGPGNTPRVRNSTPRKKVKPTDVQGGDSGGVGHDRKKAPRKKTKAD